MANIQTYLEQIKNAVYGKDVRQAIHDAIHKCYEDGRAGKEDLIAREGIEEIKSNIANYNMLINGEFRINQREYTTYEQTTSWKYSVDRWRYVGTMTVTKGNVGVTVAKKDNSTQTYFEQRLEEPILRPCVFSFEITDLSGVLSAYIEGGSEEILTITESGTYTILSNTGATSVVFRLDGTTTSATIKWAKLEVGTIATPLIPRLYGQELALCQRYFLRYSTSVNLWSWIGFFTKATETQFMINLPVQMRSSVPTVSKTNLYVYRGANKYEITNMACTLNKEKTIITFVCLHETIGTVDVIGMVGLQTGALDIDAEIY